MSDIQCVEMICSIQAISTVALDHIQMTEIAPLVQEHRFLPLIESVSQDKTPDIPARAIRGNIPN
jgi:hypothetical protein